MVQLDLLLLNHNIALVPRLGLRMATCAIGQHRELQAEDEEDFMAVGAEPVDYPKPDGRARLGVGAQGNLERMAPEEHPVEMGRLRVQAKQKRVGLAWEETARHPDRL